MATQWSEDDDSLFRLALLRDVIWSDQDPKAALLSEMRAIETSHGLSAASMLALRWRIVAAEVPERPVEASDAARRRAERDARLKLVAAAQ